MAKEQETSKPATSGTRGTRRKKGQNRIVLKGEGLNGANTVQMAQKLYRLISTTTLSLNALKLLDVYLSKINSHDVSHKTVVFEFGEVEKLFGLKQIRKEALQSQLKELLTISVVLSAETETSATSKTQYKSLLLFDKAELEQDKSDGLWKVTMMCSNDAEPLMFNIDSMGYLQHALQNSVRLPNSHSFLLFKFIESHRDNSRGYPQVFEITVDNLRAALNSTAKMHSQFKKFNAEYLKPCRNDIQENTDTRFDYEPIKRGNRIYKVRFTIYDRVKKAALPTEITVVPSDTNVPVFTEDVSKLQEIDVQAVAVEGTEEIKTNENAASKTSKGAANAHYYYGNSFDETTTDNNEMFAAQNDLTKEIKLLAAACDNEFSPRQMQTIAGYIGFFIQDDLVKYSYLRQMYEKLNAEAKPDDDRFSVLRKLIEADRELSKHTE